jgi:hypothetical protein
LDIPYRAWNRWQTSLHLSSGIFGSEDIGALLGDRC